MRNSLALCPGRGNSIIRNRSITYANIPSTLNGEIGNLKKLFCVMWVKLPPVFLQENFRKNSFVFQCFGNQNHVFFSATTHWPETRKMAQPHLSLSNRVNSVNTLNYLLRLDQTQDYSYNVSLA